MDETHKREIRDAIYGERDEVVGLAHDIHQHPELGYREEYAAARASEFLEGQGFHVEKGICGLPTAFVATVGDGPLHIAFCAEYDALPPACLFDRSKPTQLVEVWLSPDRQDAPLRHACGHNLIAGASIAAALGLHDWVDDLGLRVSVFGTPAEELFGLPEPPDGRLAPGKIALFEAGAFEGVHAVMMIHPFPTPWSVFLPTISYPRLRAEFSRTNDDGRPVDRTALELLRDELKRTVEGFQQTPALFVARPEEENTGGLADFGWVAPSLAESLPARDAVRRCFAKAGSSAGTSVEVIEYARDPEMRHDPVLSAAYRKNSQTLGEVREGDKRVQEQVRAVLPSYARPIYRFFPHLFSPAGLFMDKFPRKVEWGTDLATVSQVIPAIQPYVGIGPLAIPHSEEFAAAADSDGAYAAMRDAGVALAWTGLDAASDPEIRSYLLKSAAPSA